jgi:pyruvate dehydrogenase E2 component (dihydrolipoamide acetyltransferase)
MSDGTAGEHATFDYLLPSLGADMDAGRVVEWRVAVGDDVHRGDIMAVVETEKSDIDIEIWHDGTVEEFLVEVGEQIDVGTAIARLRRPAGAEPAPTPAHAEPVRATAPARSDAPISGETPARPGIMIPPASGTVAASPLARRLAAERGIDLAAVTGTGPSGAVVEADLPAAGATPRPAPSLPAPPPIEGAPDRRRSPATMRALIAERMARSNRDIPHYHLARDVDVGAVNAWLAERNADRPITERILPAAFYIRAVAMAVRRHPELNGFWLDDHFEPGASVNVAMAISLRAGGLVTPHVADADERTVDEVMSALTEMVAAARSGTLRSSWMTGATITITNLGDTGADLVHGVISPPQVALVGVGRVRQVPWVVDGELTIRPVATFTLAADHRATDGAIGSRFLTTLTQLLERPETL